MSVRRFGVSRRERPWDRLIGSTLLTHQLQDGPLAAWPMDESAGTVMYDASPHARHGTYVGTVSLAQSAVVNSTPSVSFGVGGYGEAAFGSWMNVTSWTAEIAVVATSIGMTMQPIERDDDAISRGWMARFTSGVANPMAWNSSGTLYQTTGGAAISTGTPYLVTMTWDTSANRLTMWLNGAVRAQTVTSGDAKHDQSLPIHISKNYRWLGRLSHAAFYDRALTADDILRHAKAAGLA